MISGLCGSGSHECLFSVITGLYRKGLVYVDVPIADDDCIVGEFFFVFFFKEICFFQLHKDSHFCIRAFVFKCLI